MNLKIVVTKKSNAQNVRMFEKAKGLFNPVQIIKRQNKSSEVGIIKDVIIERRGF